MIKYLVVIALGTALLYGAVGCRSTKKLQTAINKRDTTISVRPGETSADSLKGAASILGLT